MAGGRKQHGVDRDKDEPCCNWRFGKDLSLAMHDVEIGMKGAGFTENAAQRCVWESERERRKAVKRCEGPCGTDDDAQDHAREGAMRGTVRKRKGMGGTIPERNGMGGTMRRRNALTGQSAVTATWPVRARVHVCCRSCGPIGPLGSLGRFLAGPCPDDPRPAPLKNCRSQSDTGRPSGGGLERDGAWRSCHRPAHLGPMSPSGAFVGRVTISRICWPCYHLPQMLITRASPSEREEW